MEINNILHFLYDLGAGSVSVFWTPVFLWSFLAAGFLLLQHNRLFSLTKPAQTQLLRLPPQLSYQILTALVFALPLGALLAWIAPFSISAPEALRVLDLTEPAILDTLPPSTHIPAPPPTIDWSIYHFIGALTLVIAAVAVLKVVQLLQETYRLLQIASSIQGEPLSAVSPGLAGIQQSWGMQKKIQVVFSEEEHVPVTFGWRKAIIVIPSTLRKKQELLHMTLIHELVHIRNADFVRRWFELAISALFFFHPLVKFLLQKMEYLREANCDWEVLRQDDISPRQYASLLLDFASPALATPRLALSMSAHNNSLKKRIQAMKEYASFTQTLFASRRFTLAISLGLLVMATLMVACEVNFKKDDSITVLDPGPSSATMPEIVISPETPQSLIKDEIFIVVEEMPKLIGGTESLQKSIKYPKIAQRAGIEGRVFVQFVVDTKGSVRDAQLVKGIGAGCDEEALRAVQAAKFTPGRQRGKAVNVKMSIPVTFKLKNDAAQETALLQLQDLKKELEHVQKLMVEAEREVVKLANENQEEMLLAAMKKVERLEKIKMELAEKLVEMERRLKELRLANK